MCKKILILFALGIFLCISPAMADEAGHQRVINLQGTQNTRDIGGYETESGRQVRWGKVLRSDNLSRLNGDDFQQLEAIGLKTVIDLRVPEEVKEAPTVWQGENPPQFFNYPIGQDDGKWFRDQDRLLRRGRFTRNDTLDHFVTGYRTIPILALESYRKLLILVLDESNWPLLIHCSAGKDRSGVATALILEILGVSRENIMEDYLLTNEVAKTQEQARILAQHQASKKQATGSHFSSFKSPPADAYFPLVGVMPEMLNGFYEGVEKNYGSMEVYLKQLGIDPAAHETLTRILTE